jgi:hypothetical protein
MTPWNYELSFGLYFFFKKKRLILILFPCAASDENCSKWDASSLFFTRLKFVLSNMMDLQSCNQWVKRMERYMLIKYFVSLVFCSSQPL